MSTSPLKEAVLDSLQKRLCADEGGQATAVLATRIGADPKTLSTLLRKMETAGEITRVMTGHRTYAIHLPAVSEYLAASNGAPTELERLQQLEEEIVGESSLDYDALAIAMLRQCAHALTKVEVLALERDEALATVVQTQRELEAAEERLEKLEAAAAHAQEAIANVPPEVRKQILALVRRVRKIA